MQVAIWSTRVDSASSDVDPLVALLDSLRLLRRQDHVSQTLLDQDVQGQVVTCGFGQPQRFWLATKAIPEVLQAPDHLRQQISLITERQDRMSIRLCNCVAMSTAFARAITVSLQNSLIRSRVFFFKP